MNENTMTGREFVEKFDSKDESNLEFLCDLTVRDVKVDDELYKAALALDFAIEAFWLEFNKHR